LEDRPEAYGRASGGFVLICIIYIVYLFAFIKYIIFLSKGEILMGTNAKLVVAVGALMSFSFIVNLL
jgi:hypothetical protein